MKMAQLDVYIHDVEQRAPRRSSTQETKYLLPEAQLTELVEIKIAQLDAHTHDHEVEQRLLRSSTSFMLACQETSIKKTENYTHWHQLSKLGVMKKAQLVRHCFH